MKHSWFAGIMAGLLAACMLISPVFAKDDDEVKVRKVEINYDTVTVRVNQTRTLIAYIEPYYADDQTIYWASSNPEVVTFIDDATIQGVSPGTATITATSANGRVGKCIVTVPGTPLTALPEDPDKETLDTQVSVGATLSASDLRADVEQELNSSTSQRITLAYRDRSSVSTAALRGAQYLAALQNRNVTLRFTTSQSGAGSQDMTFHYGDTAQTPSQGWLELDPAVTPAEDRDIALAVYTQGDQVVAARTRAIQEFGAGIAVIQLSHKGSFGMEVTAAGSTNFGTADAASLKLYRYNSSSDSYSQLETPFTIDSAGTVRFTTEYGGTYVAATSK